MPQSPDLTNHLETPEIYYMYILNVYLTGNLWCARDVGINSRKSLIEQKMQPGEPGDLHVSLFSSRCFGDIKVKRLKQYLEE